MYQNGTALGESPVVWTSEGGAVATVIASRCQPVAGSCSAGRCGRERPCASAGVEAELEPVGDVFVGATFDRAVAGNLTIDHRLPGRGPALAAALLGAGVLTGCVVAAVVSGRRAVSRRSR